MTDKTLATAFLLFAGTAVCLLSWQSHRICRLEALSASLRHEIEKYDESTIRELKSLTEALKGLNLDLGEIRCTEGMCSGSKKESGHVLP